MADFSIARQICPSHGGFLYHTADLSIARRISLSHQIFLHRTVNFCIALRFSLSHGKFLHRTSRGIRTVKQNQLPSFTANQKNGLFKATR
jgi:hypothetical protein